MILETPTKSMETQGTNLFYNKEAIQKLFTYYSDLMFDVVKRLYYFVLFILLIHMFALFIHAF